MNNVVAIDGPAGSGKSTVARGVAAALGLSVLDTGAMYRSVTLAVLNAGVDPTDAAGCALVAKDSIIEAVDGSVFLDGTDVGETIREPGVTAAVSIVSAHPAVREILVAQQRSWAQRNHGGVAEGRDIGTVVFPQARVKVFITASDEERARRRVSDEKSAGRDAEIADVQNAMASRDAQDSGREVSPTAIAVDAIVLDTTGRTAEEVVADIVRRFNDVTEQR